MKMRTGKSQLVFQFLPIQQNSITSKCVRAKDKSKSVSFLQLLLILLLTLLYCRHRRRRQWWWRRQWYRHPSNRFWLTQNAFLLLPVCLPIHCVHFTFPQDVWLLIVLVGPIVSWTATLTIPHSFASIHSFIFKHFSTSAFSFTFSFDFNAFHLSSCIVQR